GPLLSGLLLGNTSLAETQASGDDLSFSVNLALWIGAVTSILAVPILYALRVSPARTVTQTQEIVVVEPNQKPSMINILKQPGIASRCRSEEHTSELQSRFDLVCRLLLEKKKNMTTQT